MTTKLAPIFALIAMLGVTACNAVQGVGEDLEAAGDGIDDAAEEAQY